MSARQAWRAGLFAAGILWALPAAAQDGDELRFCPNRPSLGASACTTDPGHVQFEYSVLDWQRDDTADEREDQFIVADLLARIGVGPQTEVQIGWTAFGAQRVRQNGTREVSRDSAVGDVRLAVRQNLRNPAGDGLSFGIEPFVILPVGGAPIGGGDWGAGAMVPVTYDLTGSLNLAFTGQLAALADEDGDGRHLNASGIIGLGYQLSDAVTWTSEVSVERNDDPMEGATHVLAAQSLAWQPTKRTQLDLLAAAGLNHATPDIRVAIGGAILF
ncbi:transporter [Croceibacterium mercuriale]|uniref:transporter n=1 Tax=Croceibacterium mercuriale TaxID=1572751 RepID=UPI00137916A1|nr:transporter [Croceibacterium mercuriale]